MKRFRLVGISVISAVREPLPSQWLTARRSRSRWLPARTLTARGRTLRRVTSRSVSQLILLLQVSCLTSPARLRVAASSFPTARTRRLIWPRVSTRLLSRPCPVGICRALSARTRLTTPRLMALQRTSSWLPVRRSRVSSRTLSRVRSLSTRRRILLVRRLPLTSPVTLPVAASSSVMVRARRLIH